MTELMAFLAADKVIHQYMEKLIEKEQWEKIILFVEQGYAKIKTEKPTTYINLDSKKPVPELVNELKSAIKKHITGIEVGLNMVAGTGKEHMAVVSALLQSGLAIRLVVLTPDGVKEI